MKDSAPLTASTPATRRVASHWQLISAIGMIVLAGGLGAAIFYREQNKPFGFELEWMNAIGENRIPFLTGLSLVFDTLGGGLAASFIIPATIIISLLLVRRRWAALYFTIAVLAAGGVVQIIKNLIGRPRPTEILVQPDFGSFPSGHAANAAALAVTLGIIYSRAWIWAAGAVYTAGMMASRTYVGAHWISDTIGGLLVGAGIAVIVWTPFAARLSAEKDADHPPIWKAKKAKATT